MIQAHGNNIYKSQAQQIGESSSVAELIARLKEVQQQMKHPLVSAKHLGLNLAVFLIDLNFVKRDAEDLKAIFINPEIVATKAPLVSGLEDDLSLPRLAVSIERPKQIEVSFLDEEMKERQAMFSDLAARWIEHGMDQLNGISIIDKVNPHRQRSLKGHLKRIAEHKIETNYELEYDN